MASVPALHGSADVTLRDGLLRLPDRFAVRFAAGLVMTEWLDGCLALWPRASWDSLAARLMRLPIADGDARSFVRLLFASAVEVGGSPRSIRLPEAHRRSAGLGAEGVCVGAGDHAEIWARSRWAEQVDRPLDDFAAALAD